MVMAGYQNRGEEQKEKKEEKGRKQKHEKRADF